VTTCSQQSAVRLSRDRHRHRDDRDRGLRAATATADPPSWVGFGPRPRPRPRAADGERMANAWRTDGERMASGWRTDGERMASRTSTRGSLAPLSRGVTSTITRRREARVRDLTRDLTRDLVAISLRSRCDLVSSWHVVGLGSRSVARPSGHMRDSSRRGVSIGPHAASVLPWVDTLGRHLGTSARSRDR